MRGAIPSDHEAITNLGSEAFGRFGDYREPLTEWLSNPGIETLVVSSNGDLQGFTMIALLEGPEGVPDGCVLAVGVRADLQRSGLGRSLLDAAVARLSAEAVQWGVRRLVASVASDNTPALRLFQAAGFRDVGASGRSYASGEVARRLVRVV